MLSLNSFCFVFNKVSGFPRTISHRRGGFISKGYDFFKYAAVILGQLSLWKKKKGKQVDAICIGLFQTIGTSWIWGWMTNIMNFEQIWTCHSFQLWCSRNHWKHLITMSLCALRGGLISGITITWETQSHLPCRSYLNSETSSSLSWNFNLHHLLTWAGCIRLEAVLKATALPSLQADFTDKSCRQHKSDRLWHIHELWRKEVKS